MVLNRNQRDSLIIQLTNSRHSNVTRAILTQLLHEHERDLRVCGAALAQVQAELAEVTDERELALRRIGELQVELEKAHEAAGFDG